MITVKVACDNTSHSVDKPSPRAFVDNSGLARVVIKGSTSGSWFCQRTPTTFSSSPKWWRQWWWWWCGMAMAIQHCVADGGGLTLGSTTTETFPISWHWFCVHKIVALNPQWIQTIRENLGEKFIRPMNRIHNTRRTQSSR